MLENFELRTANESLTNELHRVRGELAAKMRTIHALTQKAAWPDYNYEENEDSQDESQGDDREGYSSGVREDMYQHSTLGI